MSPYCAICGEWMGPVGTKPPDSPPPRIIMQPVEPLAVSAIAPVTIDIKCDPDKAVEAAAAFAKAIAGVTPEPEPQVVNVTNMVNIDSSDPELATKLANAQLQQASAYSTTPAPKPMTIHKPQPKHR